MNKVDIASVAASLNEFWCQKTIGEANGNLFKVAKGTGETNWHKHDDEEEVFFICKGHLTMQLRTGNVELSAGDLFIVPRGVEHCPLANEEVHFMIIGPSVTSTKEGGKPDWSYTESE